jgi:fatty-acyl-CoA synthase
MAQNFGIGGLVWGNARLHAARPALIENGIAITHAELDRRTNRLARVLLAQGVGKGDRVALLLNDGAQFIELLLAAGRIGALAALLNWRLSPSEIAWTIDHAAPRLVLRADGFAGLLADAEGFADVVVADDPAAVDRYERWASEGSDSRVGAGIGGNDPLFIMFTSGTTGRPKGCVHTHRSTLAHAISFALRRGFTHDDRNLSVNPLFHVTGLGHVLATLAAGGANVFVPRDSGPDAPVELALRHGCTVATLGRPLLDAWARADADARDQLRFRAVTTGAGITDPVSFAFARDQWGAMVGGGWGQTESWSFCTMIDYPEMCAHPRSIGWPIPPVELAVLDAAGHPLDDPDAQGELGIRGTNVMAGYWNSPEDTAEALGTGWLRTGDMVTVDRLGLLTLQGRLKELIKTGGENVYPAEVESVLRGLLGVADCAVAGVSDRKWGETVKAFIVLAPGAVLDAATMTSACRQRIAGYKRPRYLEFVTEIPRDPVGKILRFQLSGRPVTHDQAVD